MNFLKKHKLLFIVLGSLLAILIVAIILMFTLFSLKTIDVSYASSSATILNYEEDIKKEISLGGTVFFKDKSKYINQIEKKYPYIKVVNIETKIPNKFVLHLAARQELYAVKVGGKYAILDEELKVLNICDNSNNCIELNVFDLEFSTFEIGSFVSFNDLSLNENICFNGSDVQNFLTKLYSNFQRNNRNLENVKSLIKSIKLETYKDFKDGNIYFCASLFDYNNFETKICSPNFRLYEKVNSFLFAYADVCSNSPSKLITHKLTIIDNKKGEIVCALEEK